MGESWTQVTNAERAIIRRMNREGASDLDIGKAIGKHRSTVYRIRAGQPESPQDEPFQWHEMEEFGLPIVASEYLLKMWVAVREAKIGRHVISLDDDWLPLPYVGEFSARDARWCWYIHQAAPDLDMGDVWWLTERYTIREMAHDLLKIPQDLNDLQAYIAYGRWRSPDHHARYHQAIAEGRIKDLQPLPFSDETSHELFKLSRRQLLRFEPLNEFLPSEHFGIDKDQEANIAQ